MIFKVTIIKGDTCGNTWVDDEPTYLEANDVVDAWKKLGKQQVCSYSIGKKYIDFSRTPKGKGFGIWENNPEFNWEHDMNKATSFSCVGGGFGHIDVVPIKVKK